MTKLTKEQRKDNYLMLKALDEVSPELAIETMSDPNLDNIELNKLVEDSIMGNFIDKNNNPLKLSSATTMAGLKNILNRVIEKGQNESK